MMLFCSSKSRRSGEAAAAMGAERNYCLAAEIIGVEEGVENLGQVAPPDGVADENRVIAVEVGDGILDSRAGINISFCQVMICWAVILHIFSLPK